MNWKTLSAIGHILALIVPAILDALQNSHDEKLMLIAQVGASLFTVVNALYHSTPVAAPTAPGAGIREQVPSLPPSSAKL